MWKSKARRERETFERALLEMMPLAMDVAGKWTSYRDALPFRDDVPLVQIIKGFSMPLAEFVAKKYPNVFATVPAVYLEAMLLGIYLSKREPIPLLLNASTDMEGELGVAGLRDGVQRFITGTPNL